MAYKDHYHGQSYVINGKFEHNDDHKKIYEMLRKFKTIETNKSDCYYYYYWPENDTYWKNYEMEDWHYPIYLERVSKEYILNKYPEADFKNLRPSPYKDEIFEWEKDFGKKKPRKIKMPWTYGLDVPKGCFNLIVEKCYIKKSNRIKKGDKLFKVRMDDKSYYIKSYGRGVITQVNAVAGQVLEQFNKLAYINCDNKNVPKGSEMFYTLEEVKPKEDNPKHKNLLSKIYKYIKNQKWHH